MRKLKALNNRFVRVHENISKVVPFIYIWYLYKRPTSLPGVFCLGSIYLARSLNIHLNI